jgi:short subunit dehydrogenase-like uncharacterized protein
MAKEYDVIVYGAGGYTARYIIEQLKKEDLKLALAARDTEKIEDRSLPSYQCEIKNIDEITSKARLLVNCAGPYTECGEEVVKSCLRNYTHYIDISGETYFIETLIMKYHEAASSKGIYIINSCGFESVPADLGVMYLKEHFDTVSIESVLRVSSATFNIATWISLVNSMSKVNELRNMRGKRVQSSGIVKSVRRSPVTDTFQVLFRGSDHSTVRRTQDLMASLDMHAAQFVAYMDVGGVLGLMKYAFVACLLYLLSGSELGRWLLIRFASIFTLGRVRRHPSKERIDKASFCIEFTALGDKDGEVKTKKLKISGPDPSYISTAILASQCAVTLLESLEMRKQGSGVLLFSGGVLTPAAAFHNTDIVHRLISRGIRFELSDS